MSHDTQPLFMLAHLARQRNLLVGLGVQIQQTSRKLVHSVLSQKENIFDDRLPIDFVCRPRQHVDYNGSDPPLLKDEQSPLWYY